MAMVVRDSWTWIILCSWLVWVSYVQKERWLPIEYWFDVKSITVSDAAYGDEHKMMIDRKINRQFYADWIVTVRRQIGMVDGEPIFQNILDETGRQLCIGRGGNDYIPQVGLPEKITLRGWYMGGVDCEMLPGIYIVDTTWTLRLSNVSRSLSKRSNEFIVVPK